METIVKGSKEIKGYPNFSRCPKCKWGAYYNEYMSSKDAVLECPYCNNQYNWQKRGIR